MYVESEIILDWQQRGINARILGRKPSDNPILPYLTKPDCNVDRESWREKADAWLFGWSIEDSVRA
jgi:hypothetical protein